MRSHRGIFWYSLGLTLLLLLPMSADRWHFSPTNTRSSSFCARHQQRTARCALNRVRRAFTGCCSSSSRRNRPLLLARADGPKQAVTLCALPGSLLVNALRTTTLSECALSARPGVPRSCCAAPWRLARRPRRSCTISRPRPPPGPPVRARMLPCGLTRRHCFHRPGAPGLWRRPGGPTATAQAGADCRLAGRTGRGRGGADARAAVWAAFARQDPALLAAFPTGLRSQSARLLTDLLAADLSALEDTLTYLSTRPRWP